MSKYLFLNVYLCQLETLNFLKKFILKYITKWNLFKGFQHM
jgi:hypothetical protein